MRRQFGAITFCEKSQFIDEIEDNKNVKIIDTEDSEIYETRGAKVYHYRFGAGEILEEDDSSREDDIVTVLFASGVKKRVFTSDLEDN